MVSGDCLDASAGVADGGGETCGVRCVWAVGESGFFVDSVVWCFVGFVGAPAWIF